MYKVDRTWEGTYETQVRAILMQLLPYCVEIAVAPVELDTTCATDFTINLVGGSIAVRLRRAKYKYRDLTIRAHRDNGTKTELAKIKEGHGFRYFYGWTDETNTISEWILVDLDEVRRTGLLDSERPLISNHDGTHFIAISARELFEARCLLAYQRLGQDMRLASTSRNVNIHASLQAGIERAREAKYYRPEIRKVL